MKTDHPNDEMLIAYIQHALDGIDEDRVEVHLRTCDPCVETLVGIDACLVAVSDDTVDAFPSLAAFPAQARAARKEPRAWMARAGSRLSFLLRFPVLIPASLSVGIALGVSINARRYTAPPRVQMRAIRDAETVRIGSRGAPVYAAKSEGAGVLAELSPGEQVTVLEAEDGWKRVALADGTSGWVNAEALE